ncbi:hypothetical protein [Zooshikella harenae]|uniref:Uncharacterized protein n=1 Tax=Zooshikella harenae TaxID=2827238 RepID=A0ABS5ZJS1_9GAMM|nr:hypothetical protein [Zooshikella harenae]MBU2714323.1 hypothetical protein [Zooshikella harenae]
MPTAAERSEVQARKADADWSCYMLIPLHYFKAELAYTIKPFQQPLLHLVQDYAKKLNRKLLDEEHCFEAKTKTGKGHPLFISLKTQQLLLNSSQAIKSRLSLFFLLVTL